MWFANFRTVIAAICRVTDGTWHFVNCFLCGIELLQQSIERPGQPSALAILDWGTERGTTLNIFIAGFLRVPVGETKTVHRTCLESLGENTERTRTTSYRQFGAT